MLATRDDLNRYLRTQGTVSAGAAIDDALLDSLAAAASSRIVGMLPERTLEPDAAGADPVEVRLPYTGGRIVQVPDLRELVSVSVANAPDADVIDLPVATGTWGSPTLMRRPRELCALWLRFGFTPALNLIGTGELVIVGRWGPAGVRIGDPEATDLAVLPSIREAAIVWAARAFHNRTARYADTSQDPQGGVSSYFRNLPPDVAATIDALRVPGL